jgi:hypothetical protein
MLLALPRGAQSSSFSGEMAPLWRIGHLLEMMDSAICLTGSCCVAYFAWASLGLMCAATIA